MKLRRTILALVVVAGILVLILGITGVLSPAKKKPAASPESDRSGAPIVIKGFKTEGENWSLTTTEARLEADTDSLMTVPGGAESGMRLIGPVLEVRQPGSGGGQRLTVKADEGHTRKGPQQRIQMSGNVRVEFSGQEKGVLTTRSIEVEPDERTGRTGDEIELVVDALEGPQRISGKGAEFVMKQRTVVVSENVHMELSGGGSSLLPRAGESAEKPAATPPTVIDSRGPATADWFKRTVEVRGDVRVQQGENWLRSGRVEVQFAEKGRTPERFTAEREVRFKVGQADGDCDLLVRRSVEDELLLEGRPARVQRGVNEVKAARIELSGRDGAIVVPGAGSLKLVPESAGQSQQPVAVKWGQKLRLDPAVHQALFRGDVHFSRGEETIDCQMLSVKFDSANRQIVECRAETDVRLSGRLNAPSSSSAQQVNGASDLVVAEAKELVYDPLKDSVVLSGKAALRQERRRIRGERIELNPSDASVRVTGAGSLDEQSQEDAEGFSVSWGREMRFSRASQGATFSGNVTLNYAGNELRADDLSAKLRDDALKGFEAKGGVVIDQAGEAGKAGSTLKADRVAAEIGADRKLRSFDASGHVLIQETTGADHKSRVVSADRIVSTTDESGKPLGYEATGHVVLREETGPGGEARTIRADKVTARVDSENHLEKFEAFGRPVTVVQEGLVASGDRLAWDGPRDTGTLYGSPAEVRQGTNRLFGDQVTFSPKRGVIEVTSNRRVEVPAVSAQRLKMIPFP